MSIKHIYEQGQVTFMGVGLNISPGAMVPREETELLGNTARGAIEAMGLEAPRLIDMCCGSGNLACALGTHIPGARIWASDLTGECVAVARANVEALSLSQRVQVEQGDLFGAFDDWGLEGTIDLIVCNPPYISEGRLETDRAELLLLEPREAFSAGPYGLSIHQRVLKEALPFLKTGGALAFEIGLGQERQVEMLFKRVRAYEDLELVNNEAGEVRVVVGYKKAV